MKRLIGLRKSIGYTLEYVAEQVGMTPDTIDQWETGQEKPSIQALRDLAVVYGVCVEDLLGTNPLKMERIATVLEYRAGGKKGTHDGYWGDLGLLLPGAEKSIWYPITSDTEAMVTLRLSVADEDDWLFVPTLRSRFLMLRPSAFRQIRLLHDDGDQPIDDWNMTWDCAGMPLETYRGLMEYVTDDPSFKETTSEKFRRMIETLVGVDENKERVEQTTLFTRVHDTAGKMFTYEAKEETLAQIALQYGPDSMPTIICLPDMHEPSHRYYPAGQICLIDAPLLSIMTGARKVRRPNARRLDA